MTSTTTTTGTPTTGTPATPPTETPAVWDAITDFVGRHKNFLIVGLLIGAITLLILGLPPITPKDKPDTMKISFVVFAFIILVYLAAGFKKVAPAEVYIMLFLNRPVGIVRTGWTIIPPKLWEIINVPIEQKSPNKNALLQTFRNVKILEQTPSPDGTSLLYQEVTKKQPVQATVPEISVTWKYKFPKKSELQAVNAYFVIPLAVIEEQLKDASQSEAQIFAAGKLIDDLRETGQKDLANALIIALREKFRADATAVGAYPMPHVEIVNVIINNPIKAGEDLQKADEAIVITEAKQKAELKRVTMEVEIAKQRGEGFNKELTEKLNAVKDRAKDVAALGSIQIANGVQNGTTKVTFIHPTTKSGVMMEENQ